MAYRTRNIIVAFALLAVGVILASSYMRAQTNRVVANQKMVEVLVARQTIPVGTSGSDLMANKLVELRNVRAADLADGALRDTSTIGSRTAATKIYPGDQITSAKFDAVASLPPAAQVKGTERALAIPVGRFQTVDGRLQAGDRVDIWASRTAGGVTKTWIVARDVLVATVPPKKAEETRVAMDKQTFPAVTVHVSDVVAEKIVWSFAHSDESGLVMAARPRTGAAQTRMKGLRVDHR